MRTGIGYDIHRLTPTIKKAAIPLGGVQIPCYFQVDAHSDGDVLLHAVVDACLGALSLGDIGEWFPDNAPENRNRPSRDFVGRVLSEIKRLGWEIVNCDSIIFLEEPRLSEHKESIRRQLAQLLEVELSAISVKAKSMEGLGHIGERRALAAQVVITLQERK